MDSNRTAYGRYKMFIAVPSAVALVVDTAVALGNADIIDSATMTEVTGYNPHENGKNTHALTAGSPNTFHWSVVFEDRLDENDVPIVRIIDAFNIKSCA